MYVHSTAKIKLVTRPKLHSQAAIAQSDSSLRSGRFPRSVPPPVEVNVRRTPRLTSQPCDSQISDFAAPARPPRRAPRRPPHTQHNGLDHAHADRRARPRPRRAPRRHAARQRAGAVQGHPPLPRWQGSRVPVSLPRVPPCNALRSDLMRLRCDRAAAPPACMRGADQQPALPSAPRVRRSRYTSRRDRPQPPAVARAPSPPPPANHQPTATANRRQPPGVAPTS